MSTSTLAIPSALPGGLEAGMGMHFGHCDIYTIVQIEDGAIKSVGTLPNVPHAAGRLPRPCAASCLTRRNRAPRRWHGYASAHGLPAGGRFRLRWRAIIPPSVLAVQVFLDGKLPAFSTEFTCGGGNH